MRCLLFETDHADGTRRWAIEATEIVELLPVVSWREIPDGPSGTLGLIERHGALLPLVDLSRRLGGHEVMPRIGSRILVLASAAERGNGRLAGFLVERVMGLDVIEFSGHGSHPGFDAMGSTPLGSIATRSGELVQLIRGDRLLEAHEWQRLLGEGAAS